MNNNKIEISIYDKSLSTIKLKITNKDNFLSEKLLSQNISIKDVKYKVIVKDLGSVDSIIKYNFIPSYSSNSKQLFFDYKRELLIDLTNLDYNNSYQINACLVGKKDNVETILGSSNDLNANTKIDLNQFINSTKSKLKRKPNILADSERDVLNLTKANPVLTNFIEQKKIKSYILNARNFDNLSTFIDNKNKASKLFTQERKDKILISNEINEFFDDKYNLNLQLKNLKSKENPFMKNEWFMGPIYSYNENYKKYH